MGCSLRSGEEQVVPWKGAESGSVGPEDIKMLGSLEYFSSLTILLLSQIVYMLFPLLLTHLAPWIATSLNLSSLHLGPSLNVSLPWREHS